MKSLVAFLSAAFSLSIFSAHAVPVIAGGNGGLETNTYTNPGFAGINGLWETTAGSVSGWTFTGTGRWFMQGNNGGNNFGAANGGQYYLNLALGDYGAYSFSATTPITGLTVGQTYAVEFYASKRVGTTGNVSFTASVNTLAPTSLTVTEASLPAITSGYANYAKQTHTFVATATSHTFSISNAGTGNGNGFLVDDFSVVPVVVPHVPPGTLADYNEVWTTPSTHSWESMPLGNGETSLNVWVVGNGDLLFYIGRSDAESENNRNIKLGRVRVKLTPNTFASGLPFNQTLDLATGRILITAGNAGAQTRLQVWVDANHPVIRVAGDSDAPVSVEASYEMDLRGLSTATAIADAHQGDYVLNDGATAITWYHRNRASDFSNNLTAEGLTNSLATIQDPLMNRTFGGRMSGTGMTRSSTQKIVSASASNAIDLNIDVHAGVYPTAANWKSDLEALATARSNRNAAADLAAHQTWWSAFWNRSYLHIGGTGDQARRISKYYAHQRFINGCTTRGRYPTPFNGSTLTMDRPAGYPSFFGTGNSAQNADYRDWNGLRLFWQNTRHIYWPMLASGDYDMTEAMARVAHDILPICRERAMVRENNPGMLLYEGIGVGGDTAFGNNVPDHLSEHRGGMTDVAILLADIYDHTRDATFFNDTYLPWADEVVTYFEHKFPSRDATGKMLLSPSAAVETYKNSTNPSTEVGPLRRILSDLLRLDPGTLTTAQRNRYQALLDIMPEPPLKNVLNQPMLGIYQTGNAGRSLIETPSLYSVWPSRLSGLGRPAWLAAGRRDMASRMFSFDGTSANTDPTFECGGWLYTPTVAAQLNLPQQSKFYALRNFLDPIPDTVGNGTVVLPNPYPGKPRFHAFWESRFDYIPDQCHGGSSTIGLQHMVVQSHGDKIYLLPAWPEEWDLNFKVHAAKNTILEGVFQNGVLQSLTVTPSSRAADVINMSTAANRIRGIVGTCVADTNYLLGLPPMRDGQQVLPAATASAVTGTWFTQYGHTLDAALAGPFIAADWGGSMAKGNSIFLHVLDWPGETLSLPALALGRQITGNAVLTGGTATVNQTANGITITLPTANRDPIVTIIRLDLDASAETLARHQPYLASASTGMTATASAATFGFEAAKACDANQTTSWRHGASSGTLTIPFGGNRRLTRIDAQFDNGASFTGQNISVTLEAQSPSGSWSTLWTGTSYTQILSRPLVPTVATAIRLTTNAQGVRQLDAFAEPLGFLTWDNGAATSIWNSSHVNWTGFIWNNNTPDNAVFSNSTGTITLTEPITAGTFTFGLTNANTTGSFTGSSLSIAGNLVAQADANNGPGTQPLSFSNNVTVAGDVQISRRVLEITGGNFTATRVVSADSWARLLVTGGTATFPQGIDDSILTRGNTLSVHLQGGSLYTPYIKTTSAAMIFNYVGPDGVVLNGGNLFATANSNDFIQTWSPTSAWTNRNDIGVGPAGAKINTNGFDITITKNMKDSGGVGTLIKSGAGTLKLTAYNEYTGGTTINAGTLVVERTGYLGLGNLTVNVDATCEIRNLAGAISDVASVHLNGTGKLNIAAGVTEVVSGLAIDGVPQGVGLYNATSLASHIGGGGTLQVLGGTVSLTTPRARQIIQRNENGTASIVISGTYTGLPQHIEARALVMNGSANTGTATNWTTIVASPAGGTFSGTLSGVAAGGWYQIEVRSVSSGTPFSNTAIVQRVGVGDVYLTAGQSNSANYGELGATSDDRVSAMNYANGIWTQGTDPMPGADGSMGSVWTRLGPLLTSAENVPVGFVCVGIGGSMVSQWLPPSSEGYVKLKAAAQAFPANGFCAVLWHQGESDSLASTTPANYQTRLQSIIARVRADSGWTMPWYVAEASFHPASTLTQEEPVVAGIRRVIYADPLVFAGPSTDDFHLEGKLIDTVHFNAAGLSDHAQQWAEVLAGKAPLAAKNGNIELNSALGDGGIAAVNMSDVSSPSVIGWRILNASNENTPDGGNGYFNPNAAFYSGAVDGGASGGILPNMSGRHVAFLYAGSDGNHFLQTRRATLQPNTTYALTVALGVRDNGNAYGDSRIELLADGISIASREITLAELNAQNGGNAANKFTDVQLTYTSGAVVDSGQPLSIRITKIHGQNNGNPTYLDFDHVRLSASVSDYAGWATYHGITGGQNGDDDADGLINFKEYAFGLNPKNATSLNQISIPLNKTTGTFSYTRRQQSLTGLNYTVWYSSDLTNWTQDNGATLGITTLIGDVETIPVTISSSLLTHPKLFIQVRAQ